MHKYVLCGGCRLGRFPSRWEGRVWFTTRSQTVRTRREFLHRGVQLQSLRQSSFGISQIAPLPFKSFDEKPLPRTCCSCDLLAMTSFLLFAALLVALAVYSRGDEDSHEVRRCSLEALLILTYENDTIFMLVSTQRSHHTMGQHHWAIPQPTGICFDLCDIFSVNARQRQRYCRRHILTTPFPTARRNMESKPAIKPLALVRFSREITSKTAVSSCISSVSRPLFRSIAGRLIVRYSENVNREDVCDLVLDADKVSAFEMAVDRQYWYELFLDDLPMWGMVGEVLRDETHGKMEKVSGAVVRSCAGSTNVDFSALFQHIFTHRSLSIAYSGNRIIEVNLTSENPVSIEAGRKLEFTYSVNWMETGRTFESRFDRYLEYDFFEHRIHWFSVFNSFMMVIFLCGLVALILLRTLRNDFAKYAKDEDVDVEGLHVIGEDTGWKQVHGDVFRAPENLVIFGALLGTGWQLATLVLGVILYAIAGTSSKRCLYFFAM